MPPILTCENLSCSYKIGKHTVPVLKDINLQINAGERIFLCGASGAGKTTLLYSLAGLEKPQKGSVTIQETNLYALSRGKQAEFRNQNIGYIFQNYFLLPELTALENILMPSLINGSNRKEQALEILEQVGLKHRSNHLPAELSGGESQRVAIARALINSPALIFADEPTGNLDSNNGQDIIDLLYTLSNQTNMTLVIVTHDKKLAETGDRLIQVKDGKIS